MKKLHIARRGKVFTKKNLDRFIGTRAWRSSEQREEADMDEAPLTLQSYQEQARATDRKQEDFCRLQPGRAPLAPDGATGVADVHIQLRMRLDRHNWRMALGVETAAPDTGHQLLRRTGGPLEKSLFAPVYENELNSEEREVAVYLDGEKALD